MKIYPSLSKIKFSPFFNFILVSSFHRNKKLLSWIMWECNFMKLVHLHLIFLVVKWLNYDFNGLTSVESEPFLLYVKSAARVTYVCICIKWLQSKIPNWNVWKPKFQKLVFCNPNSQFWNTVCTVDTHSKG